MEWDVAFAVPFWQTFADMALHRRGLDGFGKRFQLPKYSEARSCGLDDLTKYAKSLAIDSLIGEPLEVVFSTNACTTLLRLVVQQFQPQGGDVTSKCWFEGERRMEVDLPPFAIVDPTEALKTINSLVEKWKKEHSGIMSPVRAYLRLAS